MEESEFFEATVGEYNIGDKALYLQGIKRGEKNEQDRIIKLLEPKIDEIGCCNCGMHKVIALIKGENK